MHFPHISVIHILKAMGLRNTLVIQHLCHGLKYRLQEFFLRSGLKLDLDLTPSHTFIYLLLFRKYTKDKMKCFQEPWKCYTRSPESLLCFIVSNSIAALCNVVSFFRYLREPVQKLRILCSG